MGILSIWVCSAALMAQTESPFLATNQATLTVGHTSASFTAAYPSGNSLFLLTNKNGCWQVPLTGDASNQLIEPTDRRERYTHFAHINGELFVLHNYQELVCISDNQTEPIVFTTPYFAKTVTPTTFLLGTNKVIYIGTEKDGLFKFVPDQDGHYLSVPTRFSTAGDMLPSNLIHTLWEDTHGVLWIGTAKGLCAMQGEQIYNLAQPAKIDRSWWKKLWQPSPAPPRVDQPILAITNWGNSLILATPNALLKISNQPDALNAVYSFPLPTSSNPAPSETHQAPLLITDINNNIWVGSESLSVFNPATGEIQTYGRAANLKGSPITCLLEDVERETIWIGVAKNGLYQLAY
ncbi:MAG: hypothetical protein R2795_17630 [Saprospiraceae bacterium]